MAYAIARLKKLKRSNLTESASHTNRERETPNADPQYCVGFGISWLMQAGGEMEAGEEFCLPCLPCFPCLPCKSYAVLR